MTTKAKMTGMSETRRSRQDLPMFRNGGEELAHVAETWFAMATECQREMIGFMSMRLEKDGETVREMIGCKNPSDATAVQMRWLEETLRDYNSEFSKLMTICTKSVNGGGRMGG